MATKPDDKRLSLALNAALNQSSILSSNFRMAMASQGADVKRPQAWREYGWPDVLGFNDFYNLYERQGVAHGVVNRLNEKCFETDPWVIEGDKYDESTPEKPWEKSFRLFAKTTKLWRSMREADVMRLVGGYAGILLQVADGKAWDQPITGRQVLYKMIPAWKGQLEPQDIIADETSLLYGEPAYWQYREGEVQTSTSAIAQPRNLRVHPDRIIILGDWRCGVSLLKAAYNSFVNLEKIEGGSGEGYLKNASMRTAVNYDKEVNLADIARSYGVGLDKLQEKFNEAAKDLNNGIDRLMVTQGATVTTLAAQLPDPSPHYNISCQTISASVRMPLTIIIGMQTGDLASSQDASEMSKRAKGRREFTLSPDAETIVEHLDRVGLIDDVPAEITVMWDDPTEASPSEMLALATQMADINQKSLGSPEGAPFTNEQIVSTAGFEYDGGQGETELPDVDPADPVTGEVAE